VKILGYDKEAFINALLSVDKTQCAELLATGFSLDAGFEKLEDVVCGALSVIGERWEEGSVSLAQVYMSGVICEELVESYLPKLNQRLKTHPKIAIAVLLDHHALGKRIVMSIIRANGYEVIDFGKGLTIDSLVQLTVENAVDILLISTLMFPSALKVSEVKAKLLDQKCHARVIVGGAPFRLDPDLGKKVGADGSCQSAVDVMSFINGEGAVQGES